MNELANFIAFQMEHEQRVRRMEARMRLSDGRRADGSTTDAEQHPRRVPFLTLRLRRMRAAQG